MEHCAVFRRNRGISLAASLWLPELIFYRLLTIALKQYIVSLGSSFTLQSNRHELYGGPMKASRFAVPLALVLCLPVTLFAKRLISDYSLRIHIYETHWNHNSWGFHAFGRANLFDEKGVPHGVEFTYDCDDHLMASSGNEAYPAMWKKQGQSIDVVFGEIGSKPDSFHDCEFKVAEKQFVFYHSQGGLGTESAQDFLAKNKNEAPTVGAATPADIPVSANPRNAY